MKSELFGVFGDRSEFSQLRSPMEFDRVVTGNSLTVGIRDPVLGKPGQTDMYVDQSSPGISVIYGDVFPRGDRSPSYENNPNTAAEVYENYLSHGSDAFGLNQLNGSYLAVLDTGTDAIVVTDPISSRECFYTDTYAGRIFGTDLSQLVQADNSNNNTIVYDQQGLCEFLQFGVVFDDRTTLADINRIPFDGSLTSTATHELSRFVYDPCEFKFVTELATRLQQAIRRRGRFFQEQANTHPSTQTGLLLSAGFDSRVILAALPPETIDVCYTLGSSETPEVRVARKLAHQYGTRHEILPITPAYLDTSPETIQYTNGIRESIHIHHSGHDDTITVDRICHGLFLDTLLRDRYIPRETLSIPILDREFPLSGLASDPDIPAMFAKTFGFESGERVLDESDVFLPSDDRHIKTGSDRSMDPEQFLHDTINREYTAGFDRADSPYNAASLLGIKCKSSLPFRLQLADQYVETLVAADAGLIEWHLQTPPEYRTDRTYQAALKRIDPEIFRHRPPDRPHKSYQANQVEKYVRKMAPAISSFGTPWPDRDQLYEQAGLDHEFRTRPDLQNLSTRTKLRIRDVRSWDAFLQQQLRYSSSTIFH